MNTDQHYKGLPSAARDFFGDHPDNQTKFVTEWRQLNDADKAEIKTGLEKLGYVINPVN